MNDASSPNFRRVLVIDDNPAIHEDFRKILAGTDCAGHGLDNFEEELFGSTATAAPAIHFEVDSAFQGQEGLEFARRAAAERRPFAMAFVDVRMPPGWDGVETIARIWEICPDLQVVICTAYSDFSWEEIISKVGQTDRLVILKKPFDNAEALQLASALTEKWRLLQQARLKLADLEAIAHARTDELRRSHAETETLVASISAALVGVDIDGRVVRWNRAAENIFGLTAKDALGRLFDNLPLQWQWNRIRQAIIDCLINRAPVELDEVVYRRQAGKEGVMHLVLTPTNSPDDGALSFILLGADITQRCRMERQLRQAQKLESVGQIAAGVAHEINTPTQFIGDNLHFLRDSFVEVNQALQTCREFLSGADAALIPPEKIRAAAAAIQNPGLDYLAAEIPAAIDQSLDGVQRVTKIVQAMKDFSHPDGNEKTLTDLNKEIESTIVISRGEWKCVAEVITHFDPQLPQVPCYPGDFNQVILNLIVNAAHAIADTASAKTGVKGAITIETRRVGSNIEIRVGDTGTGIPEDVRERIFDPFFTTKGVGKGSGQGLFIAHSVVVEKHGGAIFFETEMGRGATFIIQLPLNPAAAKRKAAA
jgi:PAS domain S-box-containing protein